MEDVREQILERVSTPVLLEQTAEECVELAHVLLKYARYLRGENPTDDNEYDINAECNSHRLFVLVILNTDSRSDSCLNIFRDGIEVLSEDIIYCL